MWYLKKKNDTNELIYKTETDSQTYRTNLQLLGGWREGIVREFGMDTYTWLYLKWIANKDVLYGTSNCVQCNVAAWKTVEFGGELDTCVCMAEFLHCSLESQHC